jgi:hypothetical protein
MKRDEIQFDFDEETQIVTVEGNRFSVSFLRQASELEADEMMIITPTFIDGKRTGGWDNITIPLGNDDEKLISDVCHLLRDFSNEWRTYDTGVRQIIDAINKVVDAIKKAREEAEHD